MLSLEKMKNNVVCYEIPLAQTKPACCAIATYTCIHFKYFVFDLLNDDRCGVNTLASLNLQELSSNRSFFVKNIKKGIQLWESSVPLRDFNSASVIKDMAKAVRAKEGLPRTMFKAGEDQVEDFMRIREHLSAKIYAPGLDSDDIPIHINKQSLLGMIDATVHVPDVDVMSYLHIDEIFANSPGLHWLNFSDKVWTTHMMVPKVSGLDLQNNISRLKAEVDTRLRSDPRLFNRYGTVFKKAYEFLMEEDGNYYTMNDSDKIIEAASFVYRLDRIMETEHYKEEMKDEENQEGMKKGDLSPLKHYTAVSFIDTVLNRRMDRERPKGRHLRCFVFTCGASSTCVMCNTQIGEFIVFDSHGMMGDRGNMHSNSYYAKNRYGFFKLISLLYSPTSLQEVSLEYLDISEVDLDQKDFEIIKKKCAPFGIL